MQVWWNIRYSVIPKAWLRVVEEQSRLTLHSHHFLIWVYGHADQNKQLTKALEADGKQILEFLPISDKEENRRSIDMPIISNHSPNLFNLFNNISSTIDPFILGELTLLR